MPKIKIKANGSVVEVSSATVAHMVPKFAELVRDEPTSGRRSAGKAKSAVVPVVEPEYGSDT